MTSRHMLNAALLATTMLGTAPAFAQTAADAPEVRTDDEIIVTAQKREENLQNVPISIQALNTRKLDELNVTNFNAFSQLLPSVSFQSTQPGSTVVYMRGVSSGGDGNHSGPLPSVGFYLDEQPVTTIGGTIDVHIYDIARIESLAGPQGTLYGASSEAGTVRIITNKPSTAGWEGRVDGEVNTVEHGGQGGRLEGMINAPISENAALRVVGWYQRNAGYIDNVAGSRTFLGAPVLDGAGEPTGAYAPGITVNNAAFVKKNFNTVDIAGGRAALKIDLDENWTITPTVLYQDQKNKGSFSYDPSVGDLQVQKFANDYRHDRFIQGALTIEGKVGNWDVTYAGAYLDRKVNAGNDYTDYAEAYDNFYASVGGAANYFYFQNAAGDTISPQQYIVGTDHFKKMSQEFRVASPQGDRFRVVAGLFYQRQTNVIHQDYQVAGLAPLLSVNGAPGTLWLTQQFRADKDYAMFGEASFDITPTLTVTAGGRGFIYDNSLIGFFGFGRNPAYVQGADDNPPPNAAGSSRTGVAGCLTTEGLTLRDAQLAGRTTTLLPASVSGGPCTNLGTFLGNGKIAPKETEGQGFTHKLNLTWKATPDLMFYGTWSRGFRPGGINRRSTVAPYAPDFLTNYEIGMKSTLLGGKLRFNATIYQQEWKKFQFAFLGANSFTEIHNGPNARIRGIEADVNFRPVEGLVLTSAASYTDAKIRQNLCLLDGSDENCTGEGNLISAAKGTRLPITPRFKINGTARYTVPVSATTRVYGQAVVIHQSSASSDIRNAIYQTASFTDADPAGTVISPANNLGRLRAYTTADFAVGMELTKYTAELFVQNAFDKRADLSRGAECCSFRPTIVTNTPRTIGLRLGAKF